MNPEHVGSVVARVLEQCKQHRFATLDGWVLWRRCQLYFALESGHNRPCTSPRRGLCRTGTRRYGRSLDTARDSCTDRRLS